MADVAQLSEQLKQKDEIINMMKSKTKDFVQRLKEDHAAQLAGKDALLLEAQQVGLIVTYTSV